MNSILLSQPHYLNECISLLSDHVNGNTYECYIADACKNMNLSEADLAPLFAPQLKMRNLILAELSSEHELLTYYFASLDNDKHNNSLASLIFAASLHYEAETYAKELLGLDSSELDLRIYHTINSYFDQVDCLNEPKALQAGELERSILARDISDAQKVKLLSLCLNFRDHVRALTPILTKAVTTFKKNEHLIMPQFTELRSKLEEKINLNGPNVLSRFIRLPETDRYALYIVPSVMQAASGRYTSVNMEDQFIFYGVHLDTILELRDSRKGQEKSVSDILKILGDKTKQDILHALRHESLYGQALAEKLGLSTATISYHLSLLLQHGFIHVNRENTRLYCTLNKRELSAALDQVRSYFCE